MRRLNAIGCFAAASMIVAGCSESPDESLAQRWGMLDQYCSDCHNDAEAAGDLSFEGVSPSEVAAHPERWEQVVRRLRASVMPPPGETHPGAEQVDAFVAALEGTLDEAAATRGDSPGHVVLHRLNRVEYATAVSDLLDMTINSSRLLPPDVSTDGFDNVAEVLRVSPTYLDQYIAAAREISIKAVGNPSPEPARAVALPHVSQGVLLRCAALARPRLETALFQRRNVPRKLGLVCSKPGSSGRRSRGIATSQRGQTTRTGFAQEVFLSDEFRVAIKPS